MTRPAPAELGLRGKSLAGSRLLASALALVAGLGLAADALAQRPRKQEDFRRELEQKLEAEEQAEEEPAPEVTPPPLPPLERPGAREGVEGLAAGLRVFIRKIRVVGSTVFTEEELDRLLEEFENREITSVDLQRARDRVTQYYIDHGYITSGAVIPDQDVEEGVVTLQVVEGRLEEIEVEGNERLRSFYVRDRIAIGAGPPVDVNRLRERLQLLQQDPLIERVNASLAPGDRRGESRLAVNVEEARAWRVRLRYANDRSPTVGGERIAGSFTHGNLTGFGDRLYVEFGQTDGRYHPWRTGERGLEEWDVEYSIPLTPWETRLRLRYTDSDAEIVEAPFDALGIQSEAQTYSIGIQQPLFRTPNAELDLGVLGEFRKSTTTLAWFGPFAFGGCEDDGECRISVLRAFGEWIQRSRDQVVAARSTFSFGLDALDSTINSGHVPDSRFFAWLGQVQYIRRLPGLRDTQVLVRADLQLADDALLPLEQIHVGGHDTVRGYRENQLVRDNGFIGSIEVRIPLLRTGLGADVLQLAPFFDIGQSWNYYETPNVRTLASLGVGLRYALSDWLDAQIYWGGRLRTIEKAGDDFQDNGWYFAFNVTL